MNKVDIAGHVSGILTALYPFYKDGIRVWRCKCKCGRYRDLTAGEFNGGHVQSCGKCGYRENLCRRLRTIWKTDDEIRISKIFKGMKKRCYNKNCKAYKNYGGRGIHICDEWLNDKRKFVNWALSNGYKPGTSIDRIDVNGPYAPWNCRWVSMYAQTNNKTTSVWITVDDHKYTPAQWAFLLSVSPRVIYLLGYENSRDAEWYVSKKWKSMTAEEKQQKLEALSAL